MGLALAPFTILVREMLIPMATEGGCTRWNNFTLDVLDMSLCPFLVAGAASK